MSEVSIRRFGKKAHDFIMTPPELDKRYTVLQGSVRSGKTWAVNAKLVVQLGRYNVAGKRLICGASKQTVYRNILLDLFALVGRDNYTYNSASGELWLFNKQYFVVGSRDEGSFKNILGMTVGVAVCDEAVEFPRSFFSQLLMRLSPEGSRLYCTTNPANPYAYFKADFLDAPDIQPNLNDLHFTLADNPNISDATKAAIAASQTGVFYQRYILGLWVVAEGSIYRDSWDDSENTFGSYERVEKLAGRTVCVTAGPVGLTAQGGHVDHWFSIDAGVDHPQVHLEFYDDGSTIWVTQEQRWDSRKEMRQKTDAEYSADLLAFMGGQPKYQVIVPPEAASLKAQLIMDGFWVTDADNSVVEGIHTVSTMLSRRKLRVSRDGCPELCKRVPTYVWDTKAAKLGKEQPLKVEDDDCDALRYGIHGKVPQWRVSGGN